MTSIQQNREPDFKRKLGNIVNENIAAKRSSSLTMWSNALLIEYGSWTIDNFSANCMLSRDLPVVSGVGNPKSLVTFSQGSRQGYAPTSLPRH